MPKRSSIEIKEKILLCLKEKSYTYAQLERKIDTGYRSIKENCEELQYFGQVNIETIGKHPANGRVSYQVSITLQGLDTLRKRKITI